MLLTIYARLLAHYGPQHWWPANSPLEVIVGAILTQNTSWRNVEKALANIKAAAPLTPASLRALRRDRLARLLRPAGYYNGKARTLKGFLRSLYIHHGGELDRLFALDTPTLRDHLLALSGIGPETADAILLYAAGRPSFVVDAYTRRILYRLGLLPAHSSYDEIRNLFMQALPPAAPLYNEYHALLDVHAKYTCVKRAPRCPACPLLDLCPRLGVD